MNTTPCIHKELASIYSKLQRFDELAEWNIIQRQEVELLEQRAVELERMTVAA